MLEALPLTTARTQAELDLQLKLGIPLLAAKGYGNLEVQAIYDHARQLCLELGESPRLFPALWGLESYYAARLEITATSDIAEQLLRLSQDSDDVNVVLLAHLGAGVAAYLSGRFEEALKHFGWYRSLDNTSSRVDAARRYGLEPGVVLRVFESRVLWWDGYPDRCLGGMEEALALARSLSHAPTLAFVLAVAATTRQSRGDIDGVVPLARELTALSTDHGMPLAQGLFFEGWSTPTSPRRTAGINRCAMAWLLTVQRELSSSCRMGTRSWRSATTHGDPSEGLRVVREAQRCPVSSCYPIFITACFELKQT
jgi:hypothetical protein